MVLDRVAAAFKNCQNTAELFKAVEQALVQLAMVRRASEKGRNGLGFACCAGSGRVLGRALNLHRAKKRTTFTSAYTPV